MEECKKKVFISYSWTVQTRVIELAERLLANGIEVILDVYDLKEGQDKFAFMEQSVNDATVDRVLIICDRSYAEKANNRIGGVGDETVIISPEIYGRINQAKFIPIIFEVDADGRAYCPAYIKSRIYIDLSSEDDRYEAEYEKLLRNIYEKPLFKKPAVGRMPDWLENDTVDLSAIRDIIKQVRGHTGGNTIKADFMIRKAADLFVDAAKEYFPQADKPYDEALLISIDQTRGLRDLFLEYCEALLYCGISVDNTICTLLERLYNELHDTTNKSSYRKSDYELYDFMIWEFLISFTALMLHYEKYQELHSVLAHTYFLRGSLSDGNLQARNYVAFRPSPRTIEGVCKEKCDQPNLYTLAGRTLVLRERKPVLSKEAITNADLVLYQLSCVLDIKGEWNKNWFPLSYLYHSGVQQVWQRLKSRQFCNRILPLFGISTIDELRALVSKSIPDSQMHFLNCFESPLAITNSIVATEVGILD